MRFYLLVILAAIALYFLLKPNTSNENAETTIASNTDEVLAVREVRKEARQNVETAENKSENSSPADITENNDQLARENMTFMLSKLSECTEIKNSVENSNSEPTLSAILDSVQSDLGEPVIRSEDWNSTEIRLPDGTFRVLRIDTVYEDDDIVKKAKYYQMNDQTMVPLELTPEQAVNPTETFIASLETEGDVVTREHSERVFFQNGEEINYVEKNGKIVTSEIIRAGKSLKCGEYGQKTFRCQCF